MIIEESVLSITPSQRIYSSKRIVSHFDSCQGRMLRHINERIYFEFRLVANRSVWKHKDFEWVIFILKLTLNGKMNNFKSVTFLKSENDLLGLIHQRNFSLPWLFPNTTFRSDDFFVQYLLVRRCVVVGSPVSKPYSYWSVIFPPTNIPHYVAVSSARSAKVNSTVIRSYISLQLLVCRQ